MNDHRSHDTEEKNENMQEFAIRFEDWFKNTFVPKYSKPFGVVVVAAILGAGYFAWNAEQNRLRSSSDSEALGVAMNHLYKGDKVQLGLELDKITANSKIVPQVQNKAALLNGNLELEKGEYDAAISSFKKATSASETLIKQGAEHGLAVSYMQKKDYAKASALLETFVKDYGLLKVQAVELHKKGEADLSSQVPDALWKLALISKELKDNAKAKVYAERLSLAYANTRFGPLADKLLKAL
jgi:TolA-binding protein